MKNKKKLLSNLSLLIILNALNYNLANAQNEIDNSQIIKNNVDSAFSFLKRNKQDTIIIIDSTSPIKQIKSKHQLNNTDIDNINNDIINEDVIIIDSDNDIKKIDIQTNNVVLTNTEPLENVSNNQNININDLNNEKKENLNYQKADVLNNQYKKIDNINNENLNNIAVDKSFNDKKIKEIDNNLTKKNNILLNENKKLNQNAFKFDNTDKQDIQLNIDKKENNHKNINEVNIKENINIVENNKNNFNKNNKKDENVNDNNIENSKNIVKVDNKINEKDKTKIKFDLSVNSLNNKVVLNNDISVIKQLSKEEVKKGQGQLSGGDLPDSAIYLPSLNVDINKVNKAKVEKVVLNKFDNQFYLIDNFKEDVDKTSINLLELYQNAVNNNSAFLASKYQNLAIKERENQALAGLLPNLSFNGSYYKSRTNQKNSTYNYAQNYTYDSYNYSFSFRQPLLRKYNIDVYKQSKIDSTRADYVLENELQDLAIKVSESYFMVLFSKANLQVSRMQEHSYKVYLDYAKKAFVNGVATRTDIDDAQAKLDNEIANQIQLQYTYEQALNQLGFLTKKQLKNIRDLDLERITFVPPKPNNLEAWVQRAFLTNPLILAAQQEVKIANKEIDKAKAGHYPTLDIVAHATRSKSDTSSTINNQYKTSAIGLQLNIPIFDGGRVSSTIKEAGHMLNNKQALLDARYDEVKLQVNKEFDTINQSLKWIKAYQTSLKSSIQALISTQKGFQAGTRNRLDILNAQQNLAQVKLNLNKSIFDYINARIKLLALTGEMDTTQIAFFNTWFYQTKQQSEVFNLKNNKKNK